MTVILSDMGDGTFTARQAHALKSALDDLTRAASDRAGASSRELSDLYATSVMVYTCGNTRARAVASVPLKLVDGKGKDVPPTSPTARAFLVGMRETMLRSELTIYFWGRNLIFKRRNPFRMVMGLRWVNPTLWNLEADYSGRLVGFRFNQTIGSLGPDGRNRNVLSPSEFVYFHTVDFADDHDGVAPAEVTFLQAGVEVEMAQTALSIFQNRAVPSLIIQPAKDTATNEGKDLRPKEGDLNKLVAFFRQALKGSRNAGKTAFQPARWEAIQLQQNLKDAAMGELAEETRRSIAIASDVPLELIIPTASTYAQIYDVRRGWYEGWVRPQVEWYCEGFTEQVAAEVNPAWQVVPDFDAVATMKEEAAARQNRVTARVSAGLLDLGRAQKELGEAEPDELLNGLYMIGGVPVPREHLRELWKTRFGAAANTGVSAQRPSSGVPAALLPGSGNGDPAQLSAGGQVAEEAPKLPPPPGSETVAVKELIARMPDPLYRELKAWAHVAGRKGADHPFEARTLPTDTAAYFRLLLSTSAGGLLSAEDVIAAARADYLKYHLTGEKAYSETALNYRAVLLDLVGRAFDEGSLRRARTPGLSRKEFGDLGRAEITAAFRQAYLDGLREGGVNVDTLEEDEENKLKLLIKAERTYFTNLANDVYRDALPVFLEALTFQDETREPGISFEQRAASQRQAVERYGDFIQARQRIEVRIDSYVFKGLEQVHTQGRLSALGNKMQKWVRDPMKDSCRSCIALDGQVHRASAFLAVIIPQDSHLLCHGDKCGCGLQDTTERARGRLDRVPLNWGAKGLNWAEHLGAIAAKSAGSVNIGFYVSLAGEPALVGLRHQVAETLGSIEGVEWVESLDLHLSLAYATDPQSPGQIAGLIGQWEQLLTGVRPVAASITHLEVWDTPEGGRALVGIVEPSEALTALQAQMAEFLEEQGMPVGELSQPEAYKPHVTLAYGEALPSELHLGDGLQLHLDNACLVTPESVITALPLLTEGEEELIALE